MKKALLLLVLLLVIIAPRAMAGAACYTPQESEAEQGIRIHSELMVIGLNCMHMAKANGNNLYLEHQKFTNKHAKLFVTYEKIMMAFLQRNGDKNPEAAMHKMRTDFANNISTEAAKMRPDKFCRTYAPRIEQVTKMDEMTFRKWASMPYKDHPNTHPVCSK